MDQFICCKEPTKYIFKKGVFQCSYCGKKYRNKSIFYKGNAIDIYPTPLKTLEKLKGRKSEYLNNRKIYSTLETGKINIYEYANGNLRYYKQIAVKKNVLKYSVNTFKDIITVSDNGIVNVTNIETEENICSYKTGFKSSKILISPEKNGWIYCDLNGIIWLSSDCTKKTPIFNFREESFTDVWLLEKIEHNDALDSFVVYFRYWVSENEKKQSKKASLRITNTADNKYICKLYLLDRDMRCLYNYTKNRLSGAYKSYFYRDINNLNEIYNIPVIHKLSDGGGISYVEEFYDYAEEILLLTNNVLGIRYLQDFIIFDLNSCEILKWYDFGYNLIQSIVVMEDHMISISAGLNSYLIDF